MTNDRLSKIASKVASGSKIYRVTTDEPVGVCVGFKPSDEWLENMNAELDEWDLGEDDKSQDAAPFLRDQQENVVDLLSAKEHWTEGGGFDRTPLGMELLVWRSEQDMIDDLGSEL